jgi:N-acetylglucosaminyl-diphospho-decaprenol L-rhamnosyltransferase
MSSPDVSVVVVSYHARDHMERSLASVVDGGYEVIVVDNGSSDGSVEFVRHRFPTVRLLALGENRGFGAANNAGLGVASGRYVLLLNSDAWPVGDAVDQLTRYADRHPEAAVVGPRLLNPDGSLQRSVRGFPSLWRVATEFLFLRKLAKSSRVFNAFYACNFDHREEREVDWLKGAVLLLRRSAVEQVGGFDTSFFLFSEEVDLCYRLRQAGWRIRFWPGAEFVHVGGLSTLSDRGRMQRELLRGQLRYFAKHEGDRSAERLRRIMLLGIRLRGRLFRGERARAYREASTWLASGTAAELLRRPSP